MSERRAARPQGRGDILAELEAEVAHELEEHRPPPGGPAYQVVGALVALAIGVTGAVLAYGYGLGTLRRPGAGLWPFIISIVIVVLAVVLLVVGRTLEDSERFTRVSLLVFVGGVTFVGVRGAAPDHRLRDPFAAALRRVAEVPRRRVVAQHGPHQRRRPSPRSTCCSSTGCASRCPTCSEEADHGLQRVPGRLQRRHRAAEPALLPDRRADRHADRRAAGPRPRGHHGDPAAHRDHRRPGLGDHHAGRHLLRRAVRRHDHLGPAPTARRGIVGGHGLRRLRAGQAGEGRHGARHSRDRLVRRGHDLDHRAHASPLPWWRAGPSTSGRPSTPRSRFSACCSSPPSAAATRSRP